MHPALVNANVAMGKANPRETTCGHTPVPTSSIPIFHRGHEMGPILGESNLMQIYGNVDLFPL